MNQNLPDYADNKPKDLTMNTKLNLANAKLNFSNAKLNFSSAKLNFRNSRLNHRNICCWPASNSHFEVF